MQYVSIAFNSLTHNTMWKKIKNMGKKNQTIDRN